MRWGELPGDDRDLLFWVLWFMVRYYSDFDLDKLLKVLLTLDSGLMGDPGWEFEYIADDAGTEFYSFSADCSFSGIEPSLRNYSVEVVRDAIKESLLALVYKQPSKADHVADLIIKYRL